MNLPEDFKNRMKQYLCGDYDAFIASYDKPEVKGLRFNAIGEGTSPIAYFGGVNRGNGTDSGEGFDTDFGVGYDVGFDTKPGGDFAKLSKCVTGFQIVPWERLGVSYTLDSAGFGKHPYHAAGVYYIQEPSAMAPVYYLDIKPGDKVLDLCASPGGKSTQIASKMNGEGILISNEINSKRTAVLSENIERMGVKNAVVTNEAPEDISSKLAGYFDKILVDAPCSGEGMFRRSQSAIDEWSYDNVEMCAKRQAYILDEAAKMLSDGGVLVYSTCTFSREENEGNIASFLKRHDDFSLAEMKLFDGMIKGFDGIGVRLYPHKVRGEGHYVCKLVKDNGDSRQHDLTFNNNDDGECGGWNSVEILRQDDRESGSQYNRKFNDQKYRESCEYNGRYEPGLSKKEMSALKDMYVFVNENITGRIRDEITSKKLTRFKDNIYMLPDECPSLKGIKVMRPGLHIGTVMKNRFEPAHALAMALNCGDVRQCVNTPINNSVIYKYIGGETFCVSEADVKDSGVSGWTLVAVDGFSVGWGKIVNGIIKNHYPKGLRIHNIL